MAVEITKVDVWAGEIQDRAGALAEKLEAVAKAGANLEFVIARRAPEKPGHGVVFVAPLKGAAQTKAAQQAGLAKTDSLHSLRLAGPDKAGFGATMTRAVAQAGINLRGLSAAAIGRRCVVYFAFDSDADAKAATKVLKKALGS
jgi:hypothetical protein